MYRKKLPPGVRDLFAELLLEIRQHVVPSDMLSSADNIGNSRYDIRGISQLFVHLAGVPAGVDAVSSDRPGIKEAATLQKGPPLLVGTVDLDPPPPPPPALSLDGAVVCQDVEVFRAALNAEIVPVCLNHVNDESSHLVEYRCSLLSFKELGCVIACGRSCYEAANPGWS